MRDLKADLEFLQLDIDFRRIRDFTNAFAREWLEQALAERERADKAEALAQELVKVLEVISDKTSGKCLCGTEEYCDLCFSSKYLVNPLRTAKEVLGDE